VSRDRLNAPEAFGIDEARLCPVLDEFQQLGKPRYAHTESSAAVATAAATATTAMTMSLTVTVVVTVAVTVAIAVAVAIAITVAVAIAAVIELFTMPNISYDFGILSSPSQIGGVETVRSVRSIGCNVSARRDDRFQDLFCQRIS
jgi:hypothetical protein